MEEAGNRDVARGPGPRRRRPVLGAIGLLFAVVLLLVGGAVVGSRVRLLRARAKVAAAWPAPAAERVEAEPAPRSAEEPPPRRAAFRRDEFGIVVRGRGGLALAADAEGRLRRAGGLPGFTLRFLVVPETSAEGAPEGVRLHLRVGDRDLEVVPVPGALPPDDVELAPEALVGEVLSRGRVPCGAAARGAVAAALAALTARRPDAAHACLLGAPEDAGTDALRMWTALARADLRAVHAAAARLPGDPPTAGAARLAVGAALLLDGAWAEARRDLDAAAAARPGDRAVAWLRARVQERLALWDEAAGTYDALLASDPGDAVAFAGRATIRARGDRDAHDGALASLDDFAARHRDAVPVWRVIGELRRRGDEDDLPRAVEALRRVAALRPEDPRAWDALGGALAVRARAAGGEEAWLEAARAFARETALAPASGDAWFNRAASLHAAALAIPPRAEPLAFRSRWAEAREAYASAVRTASEAYPAARALFNLGLLLEAAPHGVAAVEGLPETPRRAFEAALSREPDYAGARAALLGALVAEGDVPAAQAALPGLPAEVDARERDVLEAAVRWIAGDAAGTLAALARPGPPTEPESDPLPALARALLARDYRRTALALLLPEARDPARIRERARARAALRDRGGLEADLALLATLDPRLEADVREHDLAVRRALGLDS